MPHTIPRPDDGLVAAIRDALAQAGDPVRAQGQQRYMKSAMPFRGVTTPVGRVIVRDLVRAGEPLGRESWEATVRALFDDAEFREERYAAVELLRHRRYAAFRDVDALPLVEHLVTTGAWWDLVDSCQPVVSELFVARPADVEPWLRSWAVDEDLWLRRTAIIGQLGAKGDTDTDLLRDVVEANLADREFFIRKAIGWALRQHARTDPAWVRAFVESHRGSLSPLSTREAMKHLAAR